MKFLQTRTLMTESDINYLKKLFGADFRYKEEKCLMGFPGNQFAVIKCNFEVYNITFYSYNFNHCMYFYGNDKNPETSRFIIKNIDKFSTSSSIFDIDKNILRIYFYQLVELLILEKNKKIKGLYGNRL